MKPPAGFVKKPDSLLTRSGQQISIFFSSIQGIDSLQFLICLFLIAVHLFLIQPRTGRFENIFLDYFFRQRGATFYSTSIVLIEIAEDSIQAIGRWPWPRHFHAVMTHVLNEWGAKAIVFDMTFSEPSTPFEDGAFEEALQQAKQVYFPVILEPQGNRKVWIHGLSDFEKYAKGFGHINITPDMDGTLRRIQPYLTDGVETYPHLALRVAFDALHQELPHPEKFYFPRDDRGNLLINWAGKWDEGFLHYSYADLLLSYESFKKGERPLITPDDIKDKICLIGLTATGHADIKANPLESAYPALGVHANIMNSVLTNHFITPASWQTNALCLLIVGLITCLFLIPFRNIISFIASLFVSSAWLVISFLFFWKDGLWLPIMQPLLLIVSLFIFSAIYAHVFAKKERVLLFELATRDGLTGLYVIRHFRTLLSEAARDARRHKESLSLILIDIDDFKKANDTYGHAAGDRILKAIAYLISSCVRTKRPEQEADFVGRYGGEEFILALRNSTLTDTAFIVAERIRQAVEKHAFQWEGHSISITISLGVATLHPQETAPDSMAERADEALYRAKKEGKNRVCIEDAAPVDQTVKKL